MKLLLKIIFFALFLFCTLLIPKLYQRVAKPFVPQRSILKYQEIAWNTPITFDKKMEIEKILSQKFYYLSKGSQFFVFVSDDGKYVVKIPFFDCCAVKQGDVLRKKIKELKNGIAKKRVFSDKSAEEKIIITLSSCKLCFDLLKEETGLVWCHLNPKKETFSSFQVKDKRGIWHTINPEKHPFILQKRAKPLFEELKIADRAHLKHLMLSFLELLDAIDSKKCSNLDVKGKDNFGIYENKVIQMDVGTFVLLEQKQKAFFFNKMKGWLKRSRNDFDASDSCFDAQ